MKNYNNKIADKLRKLSIIQLHGLLSTGTAEEKELATEILKQKGAMDLHSSSNGFIYNGTLDEELTEEEINMPSEKLSFTKVKKEINNVKIEVNVGDIVTFEQASETLKVALENKGKTVKFFDKKINAEVEGVIKTATLDKRNNFVQYKIKVGEKVYGKKVETIGLNL